MITLFAPSIALLNRLKIPAKFILVSVIFIIPLCITGTLLLRNLNDRLDFTETEKLGLTYFNRHLTLLQRVQQHRGTANAFLSGDATLKPKLRAQEAEIDSLLIELQNAARLPPYDVLDSSEQ
ncbi:MAG TPA: hypothetical protein VFM46_12990, partial [Pseudomonadales bacterium]|nr:hypothetical protein [Pseudomonadales bacterium]